MADNLLDEKMKSKAKNMFKTVTAGTNYSIVAVAGTGACVLSLHEGAVCAQVCLSQNTAT